MKGKVAVSFLHANGTTPVVAGDALAALATQVASSGSASMAKIACSRSPD